MNEIVIYGAGGLGREVAQILEDINACESRWSVRGFLSDDIALHGTISGDLPIIGSSEWVRARTTPVAVVVAVGNPALKHRLVQRVRSPLTTFPTIVHPSVVMGRRVSLGEGTVVGAGAVFTVDIRVGAFVTVGIGCTVSHDDVLCDYATLAPGVNISGNVRVGEGTDVGTGSQVIQGVSIGEWSIVGSGAVVCRDLPANVTAVGVPAKTIKERPQGWHRDKHA
ncbi:acetyltransferase [Gemmatimonas groenlandica]|uniref:Acetyltransferase n=1 Tax=Gemmatimonas groenlandica TaxID=2732249 RepID=A0A6M4IJU7_9BACT|nr:acetyltransferase [Gemmatimonas groenlandica]QJR34118.1 acetyltransferase [Gemmatimonas groenlandica]